MVAVNEVTTYKEGSMYWADATEVVDVSDTAAWESLDPLLVPELIDREQGEFEVWHAADVAEDHEALSAHGVADVDGHVAHEGGPARAGTKLMRVTCGSRRRHGCRMTFASVEKFGEVTRTIDTNIVDALRFWA